MVEDRFHHWKVVGIGVDLELGCEIPVELHIMSPANYVCDLMPDLLCSGRYACLLVTAAWRGRTWE